MAGSKRSTGPRICPASSSEANRPQPTPAMTPETRHERLSGWRDAIGRVLTQS
jgi:hypothetical protein